MDNPEKLEI